eukprot:COSAG01_NODE_67681_length_266_cov_0.814371_1_plen_42_part_10
MDQTDASPEYGRGKFFLTLTLVRVRAGGLSAGYGLVGGVDGG